MNQLPIKVSQLYVTQRGPGVIINRPYGDGWNSSNRKGTHMVGISAAGAGPGVQSSSSYFLLDAESNNL